MEGSYDDLLHRVSLGSLTAPMMYSCLLVWFVLTLTHRGDTASSFVVAPRGVRGGALSTIAGTGPRPRLPAASSDQSYGVPSSTPPAKTYGDTAFVRPIRDLIDSEAAMRDFFSTREEWAPLFTILSQATCEAREMLGSIMNAASSSPSVLELDFHESSSPWRKLDAIPKEQDDRNALGGFLDSMHQSLLDIPVTDSKDDDDNDVQFVEEGRRLLAISRFHVLREINSGASIESYDSLFSTCWSELYMLSSQAKEHTGSLILLPDYENLADLRRFTDMNLQRPLEWLGIHGDFEIVSMKRQSPAIRLLYKLHDIPTTPSSDLSSPSSPPDTI